jgi:hypothetical protein
MSLALTKTVVLDRDLQLGIGKVEPRDEKPVVVVHLELGHRPRQSPVDDGDSCPRLHR